MAKKKKIQKGGGAIRPCYRTPARTPTTEKHLEVSI